MKKILFGILTFLGIGLSFCSADGVYHNSDLGLISFVKDGSTVLTISDKNLGSTSYDISDTSSYGYYYQRGNNYGFPYSSVYNGNISTTNSLIDGSLYSYLNPLNSSSFVLNSNIYSTFNNDLWGGSTSSYIARQGPCSNGFHIPSNTDFSFLFTILSSFSLNNYNGFSSILFVPKQGNISYVNGNLTNVGGATTLWSSDYYEGNDGQVYSYILYYGNNAQLALNYNGFGVPIRCFKNDVVDPDYTWSVLYGDSISFSCPSSSVVVHYNNGSSTSIFDVSGSIDLYIDGLSTITNTNTFTPYFNISYKDEDNQSLIESYDKSILYLENGQFKKTYTGNNDWILTVQGGTNSNFSGYLPTFDVVFTGDSLDTGNIFNNFAENSLKFTLSNIPSYIQYVIIILILFFILGFIRKFKRK